MPHADLANTIDEAFEQRNAIGATTKGPVREAVEAALDLLDAGKARVAEKQADGSWHVNQWLKKAVLLSFRLNDMSVIPGAPGKAAWWDKVPSKFDGWSETRFRDAGFPRGARRDRAPLRLYRAGRRADALLCQSRRPCRFPEP